MHYIRHWVHHESAPQLWKLLQRDERLYYIRFSIRITKEGRFAVEFIKGAKGGVAFRHQNISLLEASCEGVQGGRSGHSQIHCRTSRRHDDKYSATGSFVWRTTMRQIRTLKYIVEQVVDTMTNREDDFGSIKVNLTRFLPALCLTWSGRLYPAALMRAS